jgi:hypothetical protein
LDHTMSVKESQQQYQEQREPTPPIISPHEIGNLSFDFIKRKVRLML